MGLNWSLSSYSLSIRSLAATRGLHTRWRSVQREDAEQVGHRGEMPGKSGDCREEKFLQAFGIRRRTIEHRLPNGRYSSSSSSGAARSGGGVPNK